MLLFASSFFVVVGLAIGATDDVQPPADAGDGNRWVPNTASSDEFE
jgi:hypothetical protein